MPKEGENETEGSDDALDFESSDRIADSFFDDDADDAPASGAKSAKGAKGSKDQEDSGEDEDLDDTDTEDDSEGDQGDDDTDSGEDEDLDDIDTEDDSEGDQEDDDDFDKPLRGAKAKAKDKKREEEDPENVPADGKVAVELAKKNGRELKVARKTIVAKDLEITQRDQRIAALEKDNAELRKARITDPKDDPEYKELHNSILNDVEESAELISGVRNVRRNFGSLVTKYINARTSENRSDDMSALKADIFERCVKEDVAYEDLDSTEKTDADAKVLKVLQILRNNAPQVEKATALARKITGDAEESGYAIREREFERSTKDYKDVVEGFGELADDLIEAAPFKVESIVAKLIKENPKAQARAAKAKREVLQLVTGLRPLTREEIKKIKDEGGNVAQVEKDRAAAHVANNKKLASRLFQALMLMGDYPEMAKELADLKGKKAEEDEEVDAALEITQRRRGARAPLNKQRRAKVPTSARDRLYGGDDDDDD